MYSSHHIPTVLIDSCPEGSERNCAPRQVMDLSNRHQLSLVKNFPIVEAIVLLFKLSSPAAVTWFVVAIRILAIKRMIFGRAWSHILDKRREVHPLFTNRYASAAVNVVVRIIGIGASAQHSGPCHVIRRMTSSMCYGSLSRCLNAKASARLRIAASQMTGFGYVAIPAITYAFPCVGTSLYDEQATESLASKIDEFLRHLFDVSVIGHKVNRGLN